MILEPGAIIHGRYRVISLIGQGGMGAVYHAEDTLPRQSQSVAIKEFRLGNLPDEEETHYSSETEATRLRAKSADRITLTRQKAAKQFKREAQLLYDFHHPHLPRVRDYFEIADDRYLVMDYIQGEDLDTRLARNNDQPLPLDQVLNWITQVLDALEYCHQQGVTHRDIKPANIMVTETGIVYLVDFGIARLTEAGIGTVLRGRSSGFSPLEMYTRHGQVTECSDIYMIGATLYMLLTGHMPEDALERAVGAILPAPRTLNPDIPIHVETAILKALSLKAEDRFAAVHELRSALFNQPDNQPDLAQVAPAQETVQTPSGSVDFQHLYLAYPEMQPSGNARFPHTVAKTDQAGQKTEKNWKAELINRLRGPGALNCLACSPLTQWLAYGSENGIITLHHLVGATTFDIEVHNYEPVWCLAFAPDGRSLAAGLYDGRVLLLDIKTGKVKHTFKGHKQPVSSVYFASGTIWLVSATLEGEVRVWNTKTGALEKTNRDWGYDVVFLPRGNQLITAAEDEKLRLWQVKDGILEKAINIGRGWINALCLYPQSNLLAVNSGSTIQIFDINDWVRLQELDCKEEVSSLAFSPDGGLLAAGMAHWGVAIWDLQSDQLVIELADAQGEVSGVTFIDNNDRAPLWLAGACFDRYVYIWEIGLGAGKE